MDMRMSKRARGGLKHRDGLIWTRSWRRGRETQKTHRIDGAEKVQMLAFHVLKKCGREGARRCWSTQGLGGPS